MPPSSALVRGASLQIFMNELEAAEAVFNDYAVSQDMPPLAMYRWRPWSIQAPALYHTLASGATEFPSVDQVRDTPTLITRIAVAYGDDGYEVLTMLEGYIDTYREMMDPILLEMSRPLNGAATFINRMGWNTLTDEFNGIPYLAVQFSHNFQLNRFVLPT